jgi:hypothetical protein
LAPRLLPALVLASSLLALPAHAQTWAGERSTPVLRELVAVDPTGEPNWLFGSEDVAGDGPALFNAAEQAADVRSAYAATDRGRLWLRIYVSAQTPPESLRAFLFIDTDNDARTGGPARAPEVDPSLDMDAATNGYEVALVWSGAGPLVAWRWTPGNGNGNGNMAAYQVVSDLEALEALTELGSDPDPLRLNAPRNGYVQASLKFQPLDLSVACEANLLFRSTSGMNLRDRDVGRAGPCLPGDANDNDVADVAESRASCATDAQCPGGGTCRAGQCEVPPGEVVPGPGEAVLAPGEVVQGGAFTCSAAAPSRGQHPWWSLALLGVLIGSSRWRRSRRSGKDVRQGSEAC